MKAGITTGVVALLLVGAALWMPTIRAVATEDISAMIEGARTPADHEAIAAFYDKEASQAEAQAKTHAELAARYKSFARLSTEAMHCERMVQSYKETAAEARALAAEHRRMAAQAAKGGH